MHTARVCQQPAEDKLQKPLSLSTEYRSEVEAVDPTIRIEIICL